MTLALILFLLGGYYAATDGVLMAAASAVLPEERRGSGLGLLVTATSLGKFGAALLFGLLWTVSGLETAALVFACALTVATVRCGSRGWSLGVGRCSMPDRRMVAFVAVALACVVLGGVWVLVASQNAQSTTSDARVDVAARRSTCAARYSSGPSPEGDERLNGHVEQRDASVAGVGRRRRPTRRACACTWRPAAASASRSRARVWTTASRPSTSASAS